MKQYLPIWHNLAFSDLYLHFWRNIRICFFKVHSRTSHYGILRRFLCRRTFPWQHILDHINTFSSTRRRHGNCRMSSRSVVLYLGAIWPVSLFEVFWNGWTSTWFPFGSVDICLWYAATVHVFFFLQTHFFFIFLFPFHHRHNQYNQQQWKHCWGYSEKQCYSEIRGAVLFHFGRPKVHGVIFILKVQSLQHYPSECIPAHCDNKKATPRVGD